MNLEEKLFHTGEDYYRDVFYQIENSTKSLQLEIHYFDDQKLGKLFFKKILEALKRKIAVFIIVDGFSLHSKRLKYWLALYKKYGGNILFFNPLPWRIPCVKGLMKLNQRSHKKVILIDKKIAFVGSYNIDTRQMNKNFGGENWRDIGIKIADDRVEIIKKGFIDTWNYCLGKKLNKSIIYSLNTPIRLNHKKSLRKSIFEDLIDKMNNAKSKIWITNPYFVPDFKMLKALEKAKLRGVDVKIIIPQKSDLKLFPLINSIFYRELVQKGVGVYEYLPHILHAKIMIIDDWMTLGSSNLNSRTQKHDWEIDVVLLKENTRREILKRFQLDLKNSRLLFYEEVLKKLQENYLRIPFLKAIKYFL